MLSSRCSTSYQSIDCMISLYEKLWKITDSWALMLCTSLDINYRLPHIARARRAREIHFFLQILYLGTLRRTSHHSGGPRNFDNRQILLKRNVLALVPHLADFIRDFPYSSFILGISYIAGSNDFRRVESTRLPIPDHMLKQEILDFSMWN